MLLGSCLRLGVVLFPFAHSIIFPNEDIGNVLLALKGRHIQTNRLEWATRPAINEVRL